jgi:PKD repeat protein
MKRIIFSLVGVLMVLAVALPAVSPPTLAATCTLDNVDGIWSNAGPPTPTCLRYDNTPSTTDENQVAYGRKEYYSPCPVTLDMTKQSGFGFDGSGGGSFETGDLFLLGEFIHYNNPIYFDNGLEYVDLNITLYFSEPSISPSFTYTMHLHETDNEPPCPYSGTIDCSDKVWWDETISDQSFEIDGKWYTLQIVGFLDNPDPGSGTPIDFFITQEGQENHAWLFGRLLLAEPTVDIEKFTSPDNSIWYNADEAPGPYIPVGDTVYWRYEVTNIGTETLTDVVVTDDQWVTVSCPKDTLGPGESMNCTATGTAVCQPCQYENEGTVTAYYGDTLCSDSDLSHYSGTVTLTVISEGCCPIDVSYDSVTDTVPAGGSETYEDIPCCTDVTVSADDSAECCDFVSWSDEGAKSHTIHMDSNKSVTATCRGMPAPTAGFSADPTSGCAPLTVRFTDSSTGDPTSWSWTFGDGGTSNLQNPSHTYTNPGTYTVGLTVSNDCGEDSETGYITAKNCAPQPRSNCPCCYDFDHLTVDWDGNNTTEPLYRNDKLAVDLLGPNPDGSHNLLLERGTHAPTVDGKTHYLIIVRELKEIPPLPENIIAIVVFNVTPVDAIFDKDIFMTIGFDQLPKNALNATIAYYDDVNGVWVPVESEAGGPNGVAELTLSAAINHFSIFGVLVEVAPPAPAHFVSSGLNIEPTVETIWETVTFMTRTGESVAITANVVNDGGQGGTYVVELKLNGETKDTKILTLGAGQSEQVSFTVSGLDYGQYEVEVAGLSGEFTTSRAITWWLVIGLIIWVIVILAVLAWGIRRRRRRATVQEEEG